MSEMETTKGFGPLGMFLVFCGGALAGTAAALLLAPHSGRETRKLIGDSIGRTKDRAGRLVSAARDAGTAARESFSETMAGH